MWGSPARSLQKAASIADLRLLARRRLPKAVFDFIDGAAGDETTLHDNQAAFGDWQLMPRVGVDVSRRDAKADFLGRSASLPLMLSPTGLTGFFWPGGEIAAARSAGARGIPFCLSTNSVASLERVAEAAPETDLWFQLYVMRDRDLTDRLVARAQAAGYRVLCITVDLPLTGRRERDLRNGFTMPLKPRLSNILDLACRPGWLMGVMRSPPTFGNFKTDNATGFTNIAQHVSTLFDPSVTWADIARLRKLWKGPVAIKGILHPDDARMAVDIGADAVIVSNHGGRQLDHVPAPISALPDIAQAVGGRAQLIVDSGVRRGTDILTARALGAVGCSIGRPFLWGLASAGEAGVDHAIKLIAAEIDIAMALLGTASLDAITTDHVRRRR
ncbi:MAG: alpha-hydroxy acid oxidase [Phreatobacter sp.]